MVEVESAAPNHDQVHPQKIHKFSSIIVHVTRLEPAYPDASFLPGRNLLSLAVTDVGSCYQLCFDCIGTESLSALARRLQPQLPSTR